MNKIRGEISGEINDGYFSDSAINYICMDIISKNYPKYVFQDTIYTSKRLGRVVSVFNKDDIQILFQNPKIGPPPTKKSKYNVDPEEYQEIGHWICINYKYQENKVYIYDSFNSKQLPNENKNAIKKLYPNIDLQKDIIFKSLKTKQNDVYSCGAYSCANAISLVLGREPSQINYKICNDSTESESKYLREHLQTIIHANQITEMPTVGPIETIDLAKNANERDNLQMIALRKSFENQCKSTDVVDFLIDIKHLTDTQIQNSFATYQNVLQNTYNNFSSYPDKTIDTLIQKTNYLQILDNVETAIQISMYRRIEDHFFKNDQEFRSPTENANLTWHKMIPEWILQICMTQYNLSRDEVLQHLNKQFLASIQNDQSNDFDIDDL